MIERKAINLTVPADLAEQFDAVCAAYGHGKQKGMVLAAAMRMFMDAEPMHQGRVMQQVMQQQIELGMETVQESRKAAKVAGKRKKPIHRRPPNRP